MARKVRAVLDPGHRKQVDFSGHYSAIEAGY